MKSGLKRGAERNFYGGAHSPVAFFQVLYRLTLRCHLLWLLPTSLMAFLYKLSLLTDRSKEEVINKKCWKFPALHSSQENLEKKIFWLISNILVKSCEKTHTHTRDQVSRAEDWWTPRFYYIFLHFWTGFESVASGRPTGRFLSSSDFVYKLSLLSPSSISARIIEILASSIWKSKFINIKNISYFWFSRSFLTWFFKLCLKLAFLFSSCLNGESENFRLISLSKTRKKLKLYISSLWDERYSRALRGLEYK